MKNGTASWHLFLTQDLESLVSAISLGRTAWTALLAVSFTIYSTQSEVRFIGYAAFVIITISTPLLILAVTDLSILLNHGLAIAHNSCNLEEVCSSLVKADCGRIILIRSVAIQLISASLLHICLACSFIEPSSRLMLPALVCISILKGRQMMNSDADGLSKRLVYAQRRLIDIYQAQAEDCLPRSQAYDGELCSVIIGRARSIARRATSSLSPCQEYIDCFPGLPAVIYVLSRIGCIGAIALSCFHGLCAHSVLLGLSSINIGIICIWSVCPSALHMDYLDLVARALQDAARRTKITRLERLADDTRDFTHILAKACGSGRDIWQSTVGVAVSVVPAICMAGVVDNAAMAAKVALGAALLLEGTGRTTWSGIPYTTARLIEMKSSLAAFERRNHGIKA